jgi:hypothetical protein
VGAQVWDQVRDQVGAQVRDEVWDQVRDQVGAQVWDQVRAQVWDQVRDHVRDPVRAQVGDQVRDQVRAQVWDQVRDQVRAQVWDQMRDQVWDSVKHSKLKYESFSYYISCGDFGWLSHYYFFLNEFDIIEKYREKLEKITSYVESSFMQIQFSKVCIVSKYPKKIIRNESGRMHSVDESAIAFDDGYEQYCVNGVFVNQEFFKKLCNQEYTFEQWTKEENEEIKSIVLAFYEEKFGSEFAFNFISSHLKEVDTYTDKKENKYLERTTKGMNIGVYTLFKGTLNNSLDVAYVRCYCPSTDRMFFLGVHEKISNAKDAIASLCQVPLKLHKHLTSINRQGEMFSFNFDQEGLRMLKENLLTKEDFENVLSLSGDEYFSKLKFEY